MGGGRLLALVFGVMFLALVVSIVTKSHKDQAAPAPPPIATAAATQVAAPSEPLVSAMTFDPLYRAAQSIDRLLSEQQVKPGDYKELLDGAIQELRLARNRVENEDERRLFSLFADLIQSYSDADWLWSRQGASSQAISGGVVLYDGALSKKSTYRDFAARYSLPITQVPGQDGGGAAIYTRTGQVLAREPTVYHLYQVVPEDSMQRIWAHAARQFHGVASQYREMLQPHPIEHKGRTQ